MWEVVKNLTLVPKIYKEKSSQLRKQQFKEILSKMEINLQLNKSKKIYLNNLSYLNYQKFIKKKMTDVNLKQKI